MKGLLLKTFMVAAALAGTQAVWADNISSLPVTEDFSSGTGIFTGGAMNSTNTNIGSVLIVNNTTATATFDTDANNDGNQAYTLQTNETVTFAYTAYHGWLSNGKETTVSINNSDGVSLVSYKYNHNVCTISDIAIGGTTISSFTAFACQSRRIAGASKSGANGISNNAYVTNEGYNPSISLSIRQDGFVTINIECSSRDVSATYTGILEGTVKRDIATMTINNVNNNEDRAYAIDNLSITSEVSQDTYANYTIKYVDADGNTLKDSRTGSDVVNKEISLLDADKATFYSSDNTKKYVYSSDDSAEKTIAEDGGTVVTVTFKEASTYTYTINAVDESGNQLKQLATGTQFEGDAVTAYYSKAFKLNEKWYMADQNSAEPYYGAKFTAEETKSVTFKEADIAYFSEAEDLSVSKSFATKSGQAPGRYSNATIGRLAANSYAYTDAFAEGGTYTVYLWARNNSKSNSNITIATRNASGTVTASDKTFEDWGNSACVTRSVTGLVILPGSSLALQNTTSSNSNLELDYIYLVRTGDATVSVSLPNEYNTYCNATAALDFTDNTDVEAYTAKINDDKTSVTLTKVDKVPAGAGVVLKKIGSSETATVTVAASADALSDNQMVGVTADNTVGAVTLVAANAYVLSGQKFCKVSSEATDYMPAGKAYLAAPANASAKSLAIDFGTPTGLANVETSAEKADNVYYNIQGMRVAKPTAPGMYIVNGKKVLF